MKIGTIVKKTLGVQQRGRVVGRFPWEKSSDGTYKAPTKDDVPVLWDDGTRGYTNKAILTVIPDEVLDQRKCADIVDKLKKSIKGYDFSRAEDQFYHAVLPYLQRAVSELTSNVEFSLLVDTENDDGDILLAAAISVVTSEFLKHLGSNEQGF